MPEPKPKRSTLDLPPELHGKLKARCAIVGMTMKDAVESAVRDWVEGPAKATHPPSLAPANLIESLRTLASKSAEVTKALDEFASIQEKADGTPKRNLVQRAKAEAKAGHGVADSVGGGPGGQGKTGGD